HADTPGYRPNDLEDFGRHLERAMPGGRLAQTTTHSAHLIPAGAGSDAARSGGLDGTYESAPAGNEVILEQQLMLVAETAMQHRMAQNVYAKHLSMIRTAVTGQR
ncbi:MAG: flagellar biosynthesis protein FlgB, partial [Alphaproteobacteria bacterium]|nr:flagellar biosynthesis protein FlgB [Alphaproteobacteria bacterium]